MIAPLRRRHRWMIVGITLILAPLVFAALWHRPEHDLNRDGQSTVHSATPTDNTPLDAIFAEQGIDGRLWHDAGRTHLRLASDGALSAPDVLVYWSATSDAQRLPSDSVLLGPLPSRSHRDYLLPTASAGGHLHLYSLAHQELVASAALPLLSVEPVDETLDEIPSEPIDPSDEDAS